MTRKLDPLFAIPIQGDRVYVMSVHFEAIQNQHIPVFGSDDEWLTFEGFLHDRAQRLLGKWPVYVIRHTHLVPTVERFTGFRVFACCNKFPPDNPNRVEYAILVWHEPRINVDMPFTSATHDDIPWSAFAETLDY